MPTRRRLIAVVGGAIATSLAGCVTNSNSSAGGTDDGNIGDSTDNGNGGGATSGDEHDHELGHPDTQIDVRMESDGESDHFIPHVVHIEEGGKVRWVQESGAHDTVSYHPDNTEFLPSAEDARRSPPVASEYATDVFRLTESTIILIGEL